VTLHDVLATVAGRVSYLRASVVADGDDWLRCDRLLSDPAVLVDVVRATRDGFATDDDGVAASLFTQAYAFRVAGVALAAYALDLPVPDVAPAATSVRLDKPRPSAVAYLSPAVHDLDAAALADRLVDGHLGPFVAAVHDAFRVGDRLLWGDVAASCAAAFRAVESSGADAAQVRDRAAAFLDASPGQLDGLGAFTLLQHAGQQGWYWDRTSCCLWFRTTTGQLCDNCSLIDAAELHRRRVDELSGRTA
jgi:ferric iron reductase protein FhuF